MLDLVNEDYFEWLYDQVHRERKEGAKLTYTIVCGEMNKIVFDADLPNDSNRAADGMEMRLKFIEERSLTMHPMNDFLDQAITLFEVIAALCLRCDFQVELGVSNWFFILLKNLKLDKYDDNDVASANRGDITRKLNKVNNRTYSHNGAGGLFPLKSTKYDQRQVEIWYQMHAYIMENEMV